MRIIFSTFCGKSGVVDYEEKKVLDRFGESRFQGAVNCLDYQNEDNTEVVYLHKDGDLIFTSLEQELKCGGVSLNEGLTNQYQWNSMATSTKDNKVFVSNFDGSVYAVDYKIEDDNYDLSTEKIYTHTTEGLNKIILSPDGKQLALLSKAALPCLLDIETQKIVWKARNVPRDYLDLEVPMNDLNATFLNKDHNALLTTTANSQIRVYDVRRNKKRPHKDHEVKENSSPIGAVVMSHDDSKVYIGNHMGSVYALDYNNDFFMLKKFKEGKGAITSLSIHKDAPYLASTSLDRFLRVYNTNTMKTEWNVCLLQRLTHCKFTNEAIDLNRLRDIVIDEEDLYIKVGGVKRPRIFRDKIKLQDGLDHNKGMKQLNHNRIKLPYDLKAAKYAL